jgi:hypothetical protein
MVIKKVRGIVWAWVFEQNKIRRQNNALGVVGGAEEDRTPDLCSAIAALSHLSYGPKAMPFTWRGPTLSRNGAARGTRGMIGLAAICRAAQLVVPAGLGAQLRDPARAPPRSGAPDRPTKSAARQG